MARPVLSAIAIFLGMVLPAATTPAHAAAHKARLRPEPTAPNLFRPLPERGKASAEDLEPWEIRRRVVGVDWPLLRPMCDPNVDGVGGLLTLNLFPGMDVIAVPDNAGTTFRKDSVRWRGGVLGTPDSSITLTAIGLCDNSPTRVALSGSIKLNGEEYTIEPRPDGRVAITEINSIAAGLVTTPDHQAGPRTPATDNPAARTAPPPSGPSVIDALILYTPGAVKQAGGADEIVAWIEDAVSRANENLANSDVKASFRVVHMEEATTYRGGETVQPAFDQLADTRDGELDEAVRLREKYGADIVTTVVKGYDPANPVAGLASYPENPKNPATSDEIWSVVAANQLWAYVLAHEWGHLLGLDHDWKTSPEQNRFYPDNHGYVAPDSSFVTIMGYPSACRTPCPYADFYANPELTYDGQRLGVPLGGGRFSADNTRVMNLTAPQVAAYRTPKVAPAAYDLAIAADPPLGGIAESQVAGPYSPGDLVTVTAVASPGYRFTGWTLDGAKPQETGDTIHIRMNGDRKLVAHYAKGVAAQSRIMATATPDGGGEVVLRAAGPDTDPVPQVLANAVPARGYTFAGWLLDGKAAGDDRQLTIDVADGHHMLTARFARAGPRRSIKVTVVPAAGGRVSISGSAPTASGTDIVAQARPARGYAFKRWDLDGRTIGDNPVEALTVRGGEHLSALFTAPRKPKAKKKSRHR